jgi:hypothetical protein
MSAAKFLSFSQATSVISSVGHLRTVLIEGENGIGKTSIYHALKAMPQFANHIFPGIIDCQQLADGSIWMPTIDTELGVSREIPNDRFGVSKANCRGVEGARPVVLCFDEIGKAPSYMKPQIAPVIYERRLGNLYLPEGSIVFATTNLAAEGLGDMLQAHMRNRLIQINLGKADMPRWVTYATNKGLAPEVIATAQQYPEAFHSFVDYQPGGKFAGKKIETDAPDIFNPRDASQFAYASPRSMEASSDVVKHLAGKDNMALEQTLIGTVGPSFAGKLMSVIRFGEQMPAYDDVVNDPHNTPVPSNPIVQTVQVFKFINRVANRQEADALTTYVLRMRGEMKGLFSTAVSNNITKAAFFMTIPAFTTMLRDNAELITMR